MTETVRSVPATVWRNWAGTHESRPVRVERPGDVDALAEAVRQAADQGLRVKAVGGGHSFTGIAVTDGVLLNLENLSGIVSADTTTGLVTALAGTPLHVLNARLEQHGLAMANLGDIDRQSLAGAISTGTHGTGSLLGGLGAQVRALGIVVADGSLVSCSATERPDLFQAARVGLGAMGLIATVTMQCVPAFALHAVESPMALDDVLADLDAFVDGNDHFEFYWFPHTRRTLTKRNNRVGPEHVGSPLGRVRSWVDDELLANTVFEWTNRMTTRWPATVPTVNAVAARALTAREFTDASYRVFASPRRVVFREMEYAVPYEALPGVLAEVDAWISRSGERVSFPVEVRFAAADDVWLSTANGRRTAYFAAHHYHGVPYERYFRAVESIMREVGGRPHWGKIHYQDAVSLRELYPHFDDALAVRRNVDPTGMFTNPYLDRVLGPLAHP